MWARLSALSTARARITREQAFTMVAYTVDQRGLGKAMKHSPLWFATPLAWTLVLLGATVFAIFA